MSTLNEVVLKIYGLVNRGKVAIALGDTEGASAALHEISEYLVIVTSFTLTSADAATFLAECPVP